MNTPDTFASSLTLMQQKNLTLSLVGALAFPGAMFGHVLQKLGLYSAPTITDAQCLPPQENAEALLMGLVEQAR